MTDAADAGGPLAPPSLFAAPIDRAAPLRRDEPALATLLAGPTARVLPLWRSLSLVSREPRPVLLAGAAAAEATTRAGQTVFLGLSGEIALFACDLSAAADTAAGLGLPGRFRDLRDLGAVLSAGDVALLSYARAMLHWHQSHRYCGRCGAPTVAAEGGHLRRCGRPDCAAELFPRTDPVVIMLVHDGLAADGGRCLLGRQARWPKGMYSTLAGFVEPGETLEQAVAREIAEEVGIAVSTIAYAGSQPWPFPASLMLAFTALAPADSVPRPDGVELEDARWFTAAEIQSFPSLGLRLPQPHAIARRLVDHWVLPATPQARTAEF